MGGISGACVSERVGEGNKADVQISGVSSQYNKLHIDLKKSNALFGKSQTNQMASLRLLAIVKY